MYDLKIENGLNALGFSNADVGELVKGTLPQVKIIKIIGKKGAILFNSNIRYNKHKKM